MILIDKSVNMSSCANVHVPPVMKWSQPDCGDLCMSSAMLVLKSAIAVAGCHFGFYGTTSTVFMVWHTNAYGFCQPCVYPAHISQLPAPAGQGGNRIPSQGVHNSKEGSRRLP